MFAYDKHENAIHFIYVSEIQLSFLKYSVLCQKYLQKLFWNDNCVYHDTNM